MAKRRYPRRGSNMKKIIVLFMCLLLCGCSTVISDNSGNSVNTDSNDNIEVIGNKIKTKVDSFRNKTAKKEGANDAIDVLGKLPNIIDDGALMNKLLVDGFKQIDISNRPVYL